MVWAFSHTRSARLFFSFFIHYGTPIQTCSWLNTAKVAAGLTFSSILEGHEWCNYFVVSPPVASWCATIWSQPECRADGRALPCKTWSSTQQRSGKIQRQHHRQEQTAHTSCFASAQIHFDHLCVCMKSTILYVYLYIWIFLYWKGFHICQRPQYPGWRGYNCRWFSTKGRKFKSVCLSKGICLNLE